MYLSKTIPVPIYSTKVRFIVTGDAKKTVNSFHKKHNIHHKYEDCIEGLMFTVGMDIYNIIIDSNYLSHNTIQHETFHAVMAITADRNIFEEEQRAWLMGYLGQEIQNFLKSKKVSL